MKLDKLAQRSISRRSALKVGAAGLLAGQAALLEQLAWVPNRLALADSTPLPDIQFDIGAFVHPAQTVAGVLVDFGVTFTQMTTARLTRTPTPGDQQVLARALNTIEATYPFSPSGILVFTAYGLPYFNRLNRGVVQSNMPRLLSSRDRFALEKRRCPAPPTSRLRIRRSARRRSTCR